MVLTTFSRFLKTLRSLLRAIIQRQLELDQILENIGGGKNFLSVAIAKQQEPSNGVECS